MSVKHKFVNPVTDDLAFAGTRPSHWNDDHEGTNDHAHTATGDGGVLAGYQPAMGTNQNYVTDAEKTILSNTSGKNTGDQDFGPGGDTTEIQFNDGGVLAGSADLRYDKTNAAVMIGDTGLTLLPDNPLAIQGNVDSYLQVNLQNNNTGPNASADYIITADNGDDTQNYADLGICNSGYDVDVWDVVIPDDTYVFGDGGNVVIGTMTPGKEVKVFVADTIHEAHPADIVASFDDSGINLPAGLSYRVNGVDITTGGMINPMSSYGQIIYGSTDGTALALSPTSDGDHLVLVSGKPAWQTFSLPEGDLGDITVTAGVVSIDNSTITEAKLSLSDVTTKDSSTDTHGYLPKLSGSITQFLRGDGTFAEPSVSGADDFGITIDGAGTAITTGSKGFRRIPFNCSVTGWTILGKESGSIVIDIKKCNYAGFPTTSSIAGSEKPTLASAQSNQDVSLSTWTTTITAGDIIEFYVDSAAVVTRVNLFIHITK